MNGFNKICNTIRTLNKKTSKDTQITFYKAMAVSILAHGSDIWTTTTEQEAKFETAGN
jgi:hypothetical protein